MSEQVEPHPSAAGGMFTDTHCHLDFETFNPDREEVLKRAEEAGIRHILIPGLTVESSQGVVKMAESHPMLFAAVGIHPTEAAGFSHASLEELRRLTQRPCVAAIGEIGLDYYWKTAPHGMQQEVLKAQLKLAGEAGLPVVIHFREKGDQPDGDCAADLLGLLEGWAAGLREAGNPLGERPGVLHSFSGSAESGERAVRMGFYLGVTGPVTYSKRRQEVIARMPLERLLVETDSPFLPPAGRRGGRNEPANIPLIADTIAALQHCNTEEVAAKTSDNARRLFCWED